VRNPDRGDLGRALELRDRQHGRGLGHAVGGEDVDAEIERPSGETGGDAPHPFQEGRVVVPHQVAVDDLSSWAVGGGRVPELADDQGVAAGGRCRVARDLGHGDVLIARTAATSYLGWHR
jgi:hypothetical protein